MQLQTWGEVGNLSIALSHMGLRHSLPVGTGREQITFYHVEQVGKGKEKRTNEANSKTEMKQQSKC